MNYYDILGVQKQASQQEIKSAYRKLAMEHHPDRGGDESHFQKINQAYETLGDPNKRSRYDNEMHGQHQGTNFRNFEDINSVFNDIFGQSPRGFNFEFGRGRSGHGATRARNLDLNIKCRISFLDSFLGKELEASFMLPSGRMESVAINIPAGVNSGDTLRFKGMGDDTYPQVDRGHLNVTVLVEQDPNFSRRGDDITTIIEIDSIEAMIGCIKPVETIDGKIMNIRIRPGVSHGGEFAAHGLGFQNVQTGHKGDFIIVVYVKMLEILDPNIRRRLEDIKNEISNISK